MGVVYNKLAGLGENDGAFLGNKDRFLDHASEGAVLSGESPAIWGLDQVIVPHSVHDLDGQGLVWVNDVFFGASIGVAGNVRLHVKFTANTVAGEIANGLVASSLDGVLHSQGDVIDGVTRTSLGDG